MFNLAVQLALLSSPRTLQRPLVGRCGVVGWAIAHSLSDPYHMGSNPIEHRLFSHRGASSFSKLRSLAKCSLDDSVRRHAVVYSASYPPGRANRVAAYQW